MNLGILFAGQGSQKVGIGKDFYEKSQAFKKIFDLLTDKQKKIAFEGPMEELSETVNTQPILVAFAGGVMEELKLAGVKPKMVAGLSLGEYSALYSAGAFDGETLMDVINLRATEMDKASKGIECAMYAILAMEREELEKCCEESRDLGVVSMVNFNCPGQIVISGEKKAVEKCAQLAREKGAKRCMPLSVSGPFHTELMKPAGIALKKRFGEIEFNDMEFPVIFNAIGREKNHDETIRDLLTKQVSSSVYFEDSIRYMKKHGIDTIIEIGPGKTLSSFVRKTEKDIKCFNIETYEDLEKTLENLKGENNEG